MSMRWYRFSVTFLLLLLVAGATTTVGQVTTTDVQDHDLVDVRIGNATHTPAPSTTDAPPPTHTPAPTDRPIDFGLKVTTAIEASWSTVKNTLRLLICETSCPGSSTNGTDFSISGPGADGNQSTVFWVTTNMPWEVYAAAGLPVEVLQANAITSITPVGINTDIGDRGPNQVQLTSLSESWDNFVVLRNWVITLLHQTKGYKGDYAVQPTDMTLINCTCSVVVHQVSNNNNKNQYHCQWIMSVKWLSTQVEIVGIDWRSFNHFTMIDYTATSIQDAVFYPIGIDLDNSTASALFYRVEFTFLYDRAFYFPFNTFVNKLANIISVSDRKDLQLVASDAWVVHSREVNQTFVISFAWQSQREEILKLYNASPKNLTDAGDFQSELHWLRVAAVGRDPIYKDLPKESKEEYNLIVTIVVAAAVAVVILAIIVRVGGNTKEDLLQEAPESDEGQKDDTTAIDETPMVQV